jgi:hypothetical protein
MAQMENIKLTWDKFQNCATFKDIYQETNFLDVTLASEDHKQIKAHRVVLSASSPFFKDVLANNIHPHPILYLKGIKFKELDVLIRFIYFGEAEVPQEDLSRLLLVASELQVKGLCDQPNENPENHQKYPNDVYDWEVEQLDETISNSNMTITENSSTTIEVDCPKPSRDQTFVIGDNPKQTEDSNTNIFNDVNMTIKPNGDTTFVLGGKVKQKEDPNTSVMTDASMTNNTSITVDKGNYKCDQCSSTFKYLVNLIPHIKKKHGGVIYDCKKCDFKATNNYDLYKHVKQQHVSS